MGSNGVPSAVAMTAVAAESQTPMIALTPVPPLPPDRLKWTFVVPQPTELMMSAVAEQLKAGGAKTVGFIGFSDTWGDLVYNAITSLEKAGGFKIVTNEPCPRRYQRHRPGAQGHGRETRRGGGRRLRTPAATPHIALVERGFKGPIYHNHGTVNQAFILTGKKSVEGAVAPTGALIVAEELPDSFATKAVSLDFVKRYEATFGAGSRNAFAGYSYDSMALLANAAVPAALKKAKPGTPEFRAALRDALETVQNVIGTHGVYNMSAANHNGLDERGRVLVRVQDGAWRLMK